MPVPILSRIRQRPVQLQGPDLASKAVEVAKNPRLRGELQKGVREQVDEVIGALSVGSGWVKKSGPRSMQPQVRGQSAAVVAARAHQLLGPSSLATPVDIALALTAQGLDFVEPFSPGTPLSPFYGYNRQPRLTDYQTGRNISTDTRPGRIPFATIERLWESYDVARILTNHGIAAQKAMRPRFEPMEGYEKYPNKEIAEAKRRLAKPDGYYHLKQWVAIHQRNLYIYDAAPVYKLRDRAGNVKKLQNVSAKVIAPVLDYYGFWPEAPAPAFQEFIQGVPWDWLTRDDLIYEPFWPQTDSPYGTAPLENVLVNASTDIRLQLFFLQFFTSGSVPEAIAIAPENMSTGDDIADFTEQYEGYFDGDQSQRWGLKWLPNGTELKFYKPQMFDPDLAEYVLRRTAAAYLMNAHDVGFTSDVNRSAGTSQMEITESISEIPMRGYYEELFDSIIQEDWGFPVQLRFVPPLSEEDSLDKAQAAYFDWQMGALRATDRRRELGYLVDPEQESPLGVMDQRLGWMPAAHQIAISGDVDPRTGMPKPGTVTPVPYELPGAGNPVPAQGPEVQTPQGQGAQPQGGGADPKEPRGDPTKAYPRPLALHSGASKEAPIDVRHDATPPWGPGIPGWGTGLASGSADTEQTAGYGDPTAGYHGSTGQGTGVLAVGDVGKNDVLQAERADLYRWQRSARKAVKSGSRPRLFTDTAIPPVVVERVWARLVSAQTREEVDAAFKAVDEAELCAGVLVRAKDSGRVLLLQRALSDA